MLIDAVQSVGRFIKITASKVHDTQFLRSLELISHSMVVFDKAYNYYHQFAVWTQNKVYFVSRLKTNAVYTVIEVKRYHYRKKGIAKVLSDEIIELEYIAIKFKYIGGVTLTNKNIDVDNQMFSDMNYESKFLIG